MPVAFKVAAGWGVVEGSIELYYQVPGYEPLKTKLSFAASNDQWPAYTVQLVSLARPSAKLQVRLNLRRELASVSISNKAPGVLVLRPAGGKGKSQRLWVYDLASGKIELDHIPYGEYEVAFQWCQSILRVPEKGYVHLSLTSPVVQWDVDLREMRNVELRVMNAGRDITQETERLLVKLGDGDKRETVMLFEAPPFLLQALPPEVCYVSVQTLRGDTMALQSTTEQLDAIMVDGKSFPITVK